MAHRNRCFSQLETSMAMGDFPWPTTTGDLSKLNAQQLKIGHVTSRQGSPGHDITLINFGIRHGGLKIHSASRKKPCSQVRYHGSTKSRCIRLNSSAAARNNWTRNRLNSLLRPAPQLVPEHFWCSWGPAMIRSSTYTARRNSDLWKPSNRQLDPSAGLQLLTASHSIQIYRYWLLWPSQCRNRCRCFSQCAPVSGCPYRNSIRRTTAVKHVSNTCLSRWNASQSASLKLRERFGQSKMIPRTHLVCPSWQRGLGYPKLKPRYTESIRILHHGKTQCKWPFFLQNIQHLQDVCFNQFLQVMSRVTLLGGSSHFVNGI